MDEIFVADKTLSWAQLRTILSPNIIEGRLSNATILRCVITNCPKMDFNVYHAGKGNISYMYDIVVNENVLVERCDFKSL